MWGSKMGAELRILHTMLLQETVHLGCRVHAGLCSVGGKAVKDKHLKHLYSCDLSDRTSSSFRKKWMNFIDFPRRPFLLIPQEEAMISLGDGIGSWWSCHAQRTAFHGGSS